MRTMGFRLIAIAFLTALVSSTVSLSRSQSFSQNGDRSVEKGTSEKMETQMLKILGLRRRPRPKGNATAPQFMWDMYNLMTQYKDTNEREEEDGSRDCVYLDPAIPGNIVRSFPCKVQRPRSRVKASYQTDWVLSFNLSSIKSTEKLTKADLRLASLINNRISNFAEKFQLAITDLSTSKRAKAFKEDVRSLKDILGNHTGPEEELSVDVLSLVQHWRVNGVTSHGLVVSLRCMVKETECERFMTKLRRSAPQQQSVNLVTVSMEGERCKERSRRSVNDGDQPVKMSSNLCQRHSLYVGFRDVGWDDWIIAPTGYQAYYCAGECPFPIGEQQNGTNHAVIQTLVRRFHYRSVPDVCCAPVRLSPISLLFFDDNDNVVLRRYDDMIVESCGCR